MKKSILILFIIPMVMSLSLYAQFEDISLNDIKSYELVNPVPKMVLDQKYSNKSYSNIYANLYIDDKVKEITAYDYSIRLDIKLRKESNETFTGSINVDNKFSWITIHKYSQSFELSNVDGSLRASKWGDNYSISGNIRNNTGGYKYINLNLYKRFSDEFSFMINSGGINLYFDKYVLNGNFDDSVYSKKTIAYLMSVVFAIELDTLK
ncbi:MAG: hypothetical protein KA059_04250 [Elusimicrobiales bacterium]|jgi:hypothetical protein|nr:hypothetical protein [Elusimicrobiales bacterium]